MKKFLGAFSVMGAIVGMFLVLASMPAVIGAAEEETSTTSTVTVNEFVDITLGGVLPIAFSSVDPGSSDNAAGGAVTVTIESTTNIITDTYLKGDDWTTPAALAISNVEYDSDADISGAVAMANAYPGTPLFDAVACPCGASAAVNSAYFWLSVPAGQQAGTYTGTTIYFKTVKDGATP